jgi:hypothetical protein
VKRDTKGRAEVWIGERSWRFELLSPQGAGKSARAMCAMWPQLKNEVGHGCIRVNLHERTGNHVTMLIVWSREAGERAVAIDAETLIIVRPTRRWPDLAYNVGLDGWVLARFEHAREWDGTVPHGVVPTVIDVLGSDRDLDEDEPDEELEDEPGEWVEGEPDGDDDDWDDDPYEESEPEPTWAGFPQVSTPHVDSDDPGGGERGGATPPAVGLTDAPPSAPSQTDPFAAPPVGRPVSAGLFAPTPTKPIQAPSEPPTVPAFRPPGAGFGTMSGDLWDLVERGVGWSTRELAEAVGMAVGSAGNALARWRRMGLVACDEGRWLVTQSSRATLPADDGEAVAADGA